MAVVNAIFSNFLAFLMAFFMTTIPYKGIAMPVLDTEKNDCRLNIEMLSDTHLESNGAFRQFFLKQGLKNLEKSKAPIDAVVITGDLTNYADEPALKEYFELVTEYSPAPVISVGGNHDIGHAGDRDVTDITREQAMANLIAYRNQYMGRDDKVNYFSMEVNGYKFIVLGDEVIDGGHWDAISMSEEQLNFLDSELADGTKDGKPAFVCCHWPICNINGENTIWPESGIDQNEYNIQAIMEKYKNVYYISGHMHTGFKSEYIDDKYGLSNAEVVNGVTYLNLPTYGIINSFGLFWSGTGAQLEVYDDEVIFRPRNFITGNWYVNSEYHFNIEK